MSFLSKSTSSFRRTWRTVSPATSFLTVLPLPTFTVRVFGVTTVRLIPPRSMSALRLAERSAPEKRRPISARALSTSVEVTQYVRALPSTSSSRGRA